MKRAVLCHDRANFYDSMPWHYNTIIVSSILLIACRTIPGHLRRSEYSNISSKNRQQATEARPSRVSPDIMCLGIIHQAYFSSQ
jgi:hypothetical protein